MKLASGLPLICFTLLFGMVFSVVPAMAQEHEEDMSGISLNDMQRTDSLFYDAMKAKMQRDYKRVEDDLVAFTKLRPKNAAGWYELSLIYLDDKKLEPAESSIKKAISIDDNNKWYKSHYARVLELSNEPRAAADLLMKLSRTEQYNYEYLLRAALLYRKAKRYSEAHEALDMILAKEDDNEILLYEKKDLYLKENKLDEAAQILEGLIKANPLEGRYYVDLAQLYQSNNESKKAEEVYKRAQNMVPDDPSLQLALAERSFNNKDSAGYSENVKKLALNKSLEVDEQLKILDTYVQIHFNDLNKRAEAMTIAEELAKQHPKDARVAYTYGRVLGINEQVEKAIVQFKRSVDLDPSNLAAWEALLLSFGDKDKADSLNFYADKALRLFPNNAMFHFYKGIAQMYKGDNPAAIKTLNRAADMFPDENTAALARIYSTLGEIYNTTKEYALSDENYRKALKLDPQNPFTMNNFAYYLSVRGENLDEAEKWSRQSLEMAPNESTFLDTYGWILYKQGKYTKAKDYIQKALDKRPEGDGTVYDHLGDILYKLNDKNGALENWKKAKEKGTDNPHIDKKIQDQQLYE
jgi:tetratricopeptide (TPR) repeat protein